MDNVNHPDHYSGNGGIECIDAIKASMTPEEYRGFLKGNCMKYIWRCDKKNGTEDLKKARNYLDWLIEHDDSEIPVGRISSEPHTFTFTVMPDSIDMGLITGMKQDEDNA